MQMFCRIVSLCSEVITVVNVPYRDHAPPKSVVVMAPDMQQRAAITSPLTLETGYPCSAATARQTRRRMLL